MIPGDGRPYTKRNVRARFSDRELKSSATHTTMTIRPTIHVVCTDLRNGFCWPRLGVVFLVWLIVVVFSGSALAISLRLKLEMLGYTEQEIGAIISGKESRADIDRKIRLKMICRDVNLPSLATKNAEHSETDDFQKTVDTPDLHKAIATPWRPIQTPVTTRSDLPEKERQYLPIIRSVAEKTRIDESLIMAVIKVESDFDPEAVSPKGAMGLMQLVPSTATYLGVTDPFNPRENIHGGAEYLAQCIQTFQDMDLALAAYNAGPHLVGQLNEVPPYPETENFIRDVSYYRKMYARLLMRPL